METYSTKNLLTPTLDSYSQPFPTPTISTVGIKIFWKVNSPLLLILRADAGSVLVVPEQLRSAPLRNLRSAKLTIGIIGWPVISLT
jgi:hypothetical protein